MKKFAITALCAGLLAAPLAVRAAELVLVNSAGEPVAVVVPVGQPMAMPMMPAAFPMADIFAQQDAMMRRVMNEMQALQQAAFAAPVAGPGSTMVMSSFSSGQGSCSQTISYQAQPGGAAPIVHVQQTGNACGALPTPNPRATVPVAEPEQEQVVPKPTTPGGTRIYQIDYRHKVAQPQLRG
jgi:hypothetical protein